MVQIAGKYQLEKNVNFAEFLRKSGVPEEQAKKMEVSKPTLDIKVNGDKISITIQGATEQTTEYIVGKEVDETINGVKIRSLSKLDGNVLTVDSKTEAGKSSKRSYNFKDSELEVVLAATDVEAKRIYKRL